MDRKRKALIMVVVFVVLFVGAGAAYSVLSKRITPEPTTSNTEKEIPKQASTFNFEDNNGKSVNLADYIGKKPIVLNFWASWCGPCQTEMPYFEEANKKQGKDVQFLMVSATGGYETKETAKAFIEKSEYTFPVFFDVDAQGAAAYGVRSIPVTYFINMDGTIQKSHIGVISKSVLESEINTLLKNAKQ